MCVFVSMWDARVLQSRPALLFSCEYSLPGHWGTSDVSCLLLVSESNGILR